MKSLLRLSLILIIILSFTSVSYADVTIYGRGSGHGVGASMAGVYGMAKAGQTYKQIIPYYYANITWNTRDDNMVVRAKCQKHGNWVNIKVKDYLYRLAEEPDSWPMEGLRSLMVAARTYLWYKIERHGEIASGQYFIHDLNLALRPNIVQAVKDTTNKVVTYNNKAIVAAYSGSAGGYTAKMSEVWGGSDSYYPYLVNKDSPYDSVFSSTFKWQQIITSAKIENAYPSIGLFQKLSIVERTSYDLVKSRVKTVKITGSKGSVTDTGWNFKNKLGLKSNYFYLEPWPSPTPSPIVLKTAARKAVVRKGRRARLWYRVRDSERKIVRVYLIIKKGRKRVGKINAGHKRTNRLTYSTVIFKRTRPSIYRYYVIAIDSQRNRTKNPGSNLLIIKR